MKPDVPYENRVLMQPGVLDFTWSIVPDPDGYVRSLEILQRQCEQRDDLVIVSITSEATKDGYYLLLVDSTFKSDDLEEVPIEE